MEKLKQPRCFSTGHKGSLNVLMSLKILQTLCYSLHGHQTSIIGWTDLSMHRSAEMIQYHGSQGFIISYIKNPHHNTMSSACIACQLILAPLHQSQMYIILFITPVLLPLLWVLTLSESTELSLRKRKAALTHHKSLMTVNFKKQRLKKTPFTFLEVSIFVKARWVQLTCQLDLTLAFVRRPHALRGNAFWEQRQRHSRQWMAAMEEDKRKTKDR